MALDFNTSAVERALRGCALAWRVHWHASVGSTMDLARELLEGGAAEGLVVLADEQTAGRGRRGRSWVSPPGVNLYFTVALRPATTTLPRLSMIVALAVAEGIEQATGLATGIKWPNDIQVSGLKCSGILIDTASAGTSARTALVGIGIDVNQHTASVLELRGIAASLAEQSGHEWPREDVLAAVLGALDRRYAAAADGEQVRQAWRSKLTTIGQQVEITGDGSSVIGVVEDVDLEGSLILLQPDGTRAVVAAGDVSLRPTAHSVT